MVRLLTKAVLLVLGLIAVLIVALYLVSPVRPVIWDAPPNPGFTGVFSVNDRLASYEQLDVRGYGPEDVSCAPSGGYVTGLDDGRIVKVSESGVIKELGDTGGRPLGIHALADGSVLIADAERGLLKLANGQVELLANELDGETMLFVDDLDVAADGTVWFSDASQRFGMADNRRDFMEGSKTGRLLSFDPITGRVTSHLENLFFANGVALGPNDEYVLVNETGLGQIQRLWLTGERAGQVDLFVSELPSAIDNLSFNGRDTFWVAMPNPRKILDDLAPTPMLRRILGALPESMARAIETDFAMVVAIDLEGNVTQSLQDPAAGYHHITSVNQCGDYLLLGSLRESGIGRVGL
jgi:sugar lactone lactonase YvrE